MIPQRAFTDSVNERVERNVVINETPSTSHRGIKTHHRVAGEGSLREHLNETVDLVSLSGLRKLVSVEVVTVIHIHVCMHV